MRRILFGVILAAVAMIIGRRRTSSTVEQEYADEAPTFDERWREYINVTVDAMLGKVGKELAGLPCHQACRLLDVGCGTGALAHAVAERFPEWEIVCSDPSPEMLAGASAKGLSVVQARSEDLPFPAKSFDVVTSLSSFHFWDAPRQGLDELARVLRPGGKLLISDWSHDFLSCKICGWYLWAAGFPANDWNILSMGHMRALLHGSGFNIVDEHAYLINLRPFGLRWCPRWGMMSFSVSKREELTIL